MSNRDLNDLTPNTKAKYLALKKRVKEVLGYDIFLTDGHRTAKQQYELYQQGRTKPGNVVTYVDGKNRKSSHQFGVAFDIAFRGDELYPSKHKPRQQVAEIAKELGLEWGYDLRDLDKPHFQNTGDKSLRNELVQEAIDKGYYNGQEGDGLTDRVVLFTMKTIKGECTELSCPHGEIPTGQLSSDNGEVSTMRGFNKVKMHNGVITVSVMNEPEEFVEPFFTIMLRNALRNISSHIQTPIERIHDNQQNAGIRIYFVKPGDDRLPVEFKEDSLAYGIAPADHKNAGEIYVNEKIDWFDGSHFWIRNVLEHEIMHTLNIGHSSNPESIMYAKYEKGEHQKRYTDGVVDLLQKLY